MTKLYKEVTWTIVPKGTPAVIRNCRNCNKKMDFYCSEKFRLNGNHTRVDIWLIYKCVKCDSTWKLTIRKGVKPHAFPSETYQRFIDNDVSLAWQYAFDRNLQTQNECEMSYAGLEYNVDGFEPVDLDSSLLIHIKSVYRFELKLSTFLCRQLSISQNILKQLIKSGIVTARPACDMMKYRIRTDMDIYIH